MLYSGILKLYDKISLENCVFVNSSLNKHLPIIFHNWFDLIHESHNYETRLSEIGCLKIPAYHTKTYGRYSVAINAIYTWNYLQKIHKETLFHNLKICKLRRILSEHFRNIYN